MSGIRLLFAEEERTTSASLSPDSLGHGQDSDDDVIEVDYEGANQTFDFDTPPSKILNLCMKRGAPTQAILLEKGKLTDFIPKVAYHVNKKIGKFDILYPVVNANNKTTWSSLPSKSKYMAESLDIMYQRVKNGAVIKWTVETQIPAARREKACESLYKKYISIPIVCKRSYELLRDENALKEGYLEFFLFKLKLVRFMLGHMDSINLLDPAHFKCPIKSCVSIVKLRSFSNTADVRLYSLLTKQMKEVLYLI